MKSFLRLLTNKVFVVAVVVILELGLILWATWNISIDYSLVYGVFLVLALMLVVHIINRNDNPTYQMSWTILLLTIPPVGVVLYLLFGGKQVPKRLRLKMKETYAKEVLVEDANTVDALNTMYPRWDRLVNYLRINAQYPVHSNTKSVYLESGEKKFESMIYDLEQAREFIFMEYFIVKDGIVWQTVYDILARKVKDGVKVRLILDDWGSALFSDLKKMVDKAGIETIFFNELKPQLAIEMNNRDHRKILVIDGKIGYVGGMNLADEYINIGSKFGHWKDTAVRIEGDAVYSLTLMFLQIYRYYTGKYEDPLLYKYDFPKNEMMDGFVLPYGDIPTDKRDIGLDVHLSMIYNAKDYIYIQTPYLIIGYEMIQALCNAARSGVDVRIIVPGVPDKKTVNQMTKANYDILVEHGVRIYEYTPGFVHSKTVVCDDEVCTVGTINMDFRSYYLHFECNILFIGNNIVQDCLKDVQETILVSKEVTMEQIQQNSIVTTWYRSVLRLFSGIM